MSNKFITPEEFYKGVAKIVDEEDKKTPGFKEALHDTIIAVLKKLEGVKK